MNLHTLLVEDSPTQAQYYREVLEGLGLTVSLAQDGKTALDIAIDEQPDVIILDVNLPGDMDGIQVCYRLNRLPETASIPVIMLTQRDNPKDAVEGMRVGAIDYIAKDEFADEILAETLRQLGLVQ